MCITTEGKGKLTSCDNTNNTSVEDGNNSTTMNETHLLYSRTIATKRKPMVPFEEAWQNDERVYNKRKIEDCALGFSPPVDIISP